MPDGKLAIKLGADYLKNNGTFRNVAFGGRDGDRDTKTYIVALRATPDDRLDFTLSYERMEDDSELVPFVPGYVPYVISSPANGYFSGMNNQCINPFLLASCSATINKKRNTVEQPRQAPAYFNLDAITFDGSYDLGTVKAFAITGYRRTRQFDISDFDATRFALFRDQRKNRTHQFSQELRLESDFSDNFKVIGGAFYYNGGYTTDQRVSLDLAGVTPDTPPGVAYLNGVASYNVTIDTRSFALFAQAEYKMDKFKLIVGGRQTWDRKKIDADFYTTTVATNRNVDNFTVGETAKQTARFKKFTPKFVLQYEPNRDFQAYVSYSKGYNSGGFYGRPAGAAFVAPFKPESMDAYEIGFKSEWFDRRLRLNVSAYHNILKNKQEDLLKINPDGAQFSTTLNAAKAQYNGVEIELSASPVRGLTISSATGYLDAKYKDFIGDLGQGVTDLSVLKLRRTPHWTQGLIGSYVFDLGTGEVSLSSSLQYLSRYETNNLNDPRYSVPATTRIDLGAGYKFPIRANVDLALNFSVKNVTDNTTFAGGSSGNTVGTFIEELIPTIGRTWGVSATVSF